MRDDLLACRPGRATRRARARQGHPATRHPSTDRRDRPMKQHPDINDTLRTDGIDAARARSDKARPFKFIIEDEHLPPPPADDTTTNLKRLAKLPVIQYEQERKVAAERLGIRAVILDRLVGAERDKLGLEADGRQGGAVSFP